MDNIIKSGKIKQFIKEDFYTNILGKNDASYKYQYNRKGRNMQENFKLIEGLNIENTLGVKSSYIKVNDSEISCVISAEKIKSIISKAVKLIKKPYFFIEVPCTEAQEAELSKNGDNGLHLQLYNLEVTTKVADAILKRYGDLLINDGVTNFGFGSLETETEIYVMPFQSIMFYSQNNITVFEKILNDFNIIKTSNKDYISIDSLISKENPADRVLVELNGETVFDVIDSLQDEGLTACDIIKEN